VGRKFSLVLNREMTDEESASLQQVTCCRASCSADSLSTGAGTAVARLDGGDPASPSLAAMTEAALEAVGSVPGLTVPRLLVPALGDSGIAL
jgi:hypothetical protein